MPRSSYRRRHRKRSSSSKSSNDEKEKEEYYRDRSKKKSDSYYSRSSSRKKSESRSSQSHKKRSRRSPSTSDSSTNTNSSSKSSHKSATVEPTKQPESLNLNLLDGKINPQALIDIEDDSFQQKPFTSNKPLQQKVIIDLQKDIITVPTVECPELDDSIFHPNFLGDETKKMEKWIRKLYNYRQRLVNE